ncbi:hypothetical protein [Roseobacter sp.]|uniref:hypothetical protein n=1 Tax=Roseobacter sp. TaxID=1907202 RepID=UPI00385937AC
MQRSGPKLDRLLSVVASAEAPKGYNSIHCSAKRLPCKKPVRMTLGEIPAWTRATSGQNHAIGRYQIIPKTLDRLTRALRLPRSTRFDKHTQDMMARLLVDEAGFSKFLTARISQDQFMDNLARVWAGLPVRSGRSAYHRYAGNRATISRAQFASAMREIFG